MECKSDLEHALLLKFDGRESELLTQCSHSVFLRRANSKGEKNLQAGQKGSRVARTVSLFVSMARQIRKTSVDLLMYVQMDLATQ